MLELYGHPFAAFVWKVLIALGEREVPFAFQMVDADHPDHAARVATLSPAGQMPLLVDDGHAVAQSSVIVEYLDRHGTAPPLVPAGRDAALEIRLVASVCDDYVAAPMQRIVAEALRPSADQEAGRIDAARATLDRSYRWLAERIAGRAWAAGDRFTLADCAAAPALFYADWVHPIPATLPALRGFRQRLLAHPSVARVVEDARPYRHLFPPGAPARD